MPRNRGNTYTRNQEKALRSASPDGMIHNLPHSTARALRDRSLGEILAKSGRAMPNGHVPISRQFPTVTFRLTDEGVREAARLLMAAGNPEAAEKLQVAPLPAGNK